MKESPIFARTHDLLLWLIPQTTNHFPRSQRFVMAKRVQDSALDFQELILEAALSNGPQRTERLVQADTKLAGLRFHLRLCHEMGLFSSCQYEHVARMITEIGRLLGGWRQSKATPVA